MNYYQLLLRDIKYLIEFFVDQPLDYFMSMKGLKEIIFKFEQMK